MISPDEQRVLINVAEKIPPDDPGAHNNLAIVFYNKGLYQEAIEELQKALDLDPKFVLARNNLDIILRKTGKLEERVEQLSKDIEKDPNDETKVLELADLYVKLKKYSHGIMYYKKIIDANPDSYQAHFGFSMALKRLSKYDDALEEMNRALAIEKSHKGYHALGEIHLRKGVVDMAIKNLQEALKFDDSSAETYFLLGFALGEKGRTEESVAAIQKAIALNPSLAQGDTDFPIDDEGEHWKSVRERLDMETAPADSDRIHFNMGMSYRNKGLFDEAAREFRECLKSNEDAPEVHYALAELNIFLRKFDEAVMHLERAQAVGFDELKCMNALGIAYLMQGRAADAVESFQKVLAKNVNESLVLNNLAVAQYSLGDLSRAMVNYQKAVDNGNDDARFNLAMHHLKNDDFKKSLELLEGDGVDVHFGRGLTYMEQGDDEKALDAFKRVLDIFPNHAGAYYNMGFIATRLGKFEESLAHIRKGMEIEPNYDNVRYHLSLDLAISDFGPYYTPRSQASTATVVEKNRKQPSRKSPDELLSLVEEHLGRNETSEAVSKLDAALEIDPSLTRALVLKADILFHHGDTDRAIKSLEEYEQRQPDNTDVVSALAHVFKESGQLESALIRYRHLVQLQPDNPVWLNEVADIEYSLGEEDDAMASYLRVLDVEPENLAAHLRLLRIYMNRNDFVEARRFIEFLEETHPDNYDYNVLAGVYWSEKKDNDKAEGHFDKATEIDASKPLPYYHRGLLSLQRGAFGAATESWKKALLLSPPDDLANRIKHCLKLTIELSEILEKEI
ncbi:MAG: tetratricopeptide repeat protein [candidate division WOR-3 bacterium]|nr:MAG: tetratricopeptide repeat protein [candidate division WOR-3 bacterium]